MKSFREKEILNMLNTMDTDRAKTEKEANESEEFEGK